MSGSAAMQAPAMPDTAQGDWWWLAGGLVVVWALRLAQFSATGAGLHVDEAQYWHWSQQLQWGYYSKPPLIAALIAASTALFGDGVLGVKALAMACYPLTAAVLHGLGTDLGGRAAGRWAAAIFVASPLAGLLGLAATTDGPLLLCWATAMWALWRGVQAGSRRAWFVFALACGAGLLDKYTMAALLPGALWFAGRTGGRVALRRALVSLAGAGLMLLPHLAWNAGHDWPTLTHTASITVGSGREGHTGLRVLGFLLAQPLIVGPLALLTLLGLAGAGRVGASAAVRRLLLACAAPLALAGAAQALHGRVEVNWPAPALLSAMLALALVMSARRGGRTGLGLGAALAAQALLVAGLTLLPAAWQRLSPGGFPPAALDAFARMRAWDPALAALRPDARWAGATLVGDDRTVLAQAVYGWRGLGLRPTSLQTDTTFAFAWPLDCALAGAGPFLVLSEGPPRPALAARFETLRPLGQVDLPRARGRRLQLMLAEGLGPRSGGPCP